MSYTQAFPVRNHAHVIATIGQDAPAAPVTGVVSAGSSVWYSTDGALYVPIAIRRACVITKLGIVNGSVASGNFDLGLYTASGIRLVSKGSTAQSGTSIEQVVDVTDTSVTPGLYYLACAMNGTTGTVTRTSLTAPIPVSCGVWSQASAFPLPATATFAITQTLGFYPYLLAFTGTVVS